MENAAEERKIPGKLGILFEIKKYYTKGVLTLLCALPSSS